MNKVYRTVFNEKTNTWVAVAETAKAHGKSGRSGGVVAAVADGMLLNKKMLAVSAAVAAALAAQPAMADNARIENGSAQQTIAISPSDSTAGNGGAKATGETSIAAGWNATATGNESIAVGNDASTATDPISATHPRILLHTSPGAKATHNIAIGAKSKSGGLETIAIGSKSYAARTQSISLGHDSKATGDQSVALGANTIAQGDSSIAIGGDDLDLVASTVFRQTSATADNDAYNDTPVAQTYRALTGQNLVDFTSTSNRYIGTTTGQAGVAVGVSAKAADLATAIGTKSHATGDYSVALGVGANTDKANAVALGAGSTTAANATDVASATIGSITYGSAATPFAGSGNVKPGDQVSVGSASYERQIKHVAPGDIAATSTDAINGSQLFYVTQGLQNQIGGLGFGVNADNNSLKTHQLGKELAIVAGNTTESTSTNNLKTNVIQDAVTGKTTVTVSMKEAPTFSSVTTQDAAGNKTVTNAGGVTITPVSGSPVSLTKDGLNNGGNKITGVANGTIAAGSKEAINGGQLHDLKENGFKIAADNGTPDTVKLTETVTYKGDSNIVTTVTNNQVGFKLADSITVGPATGGNPVKIDGNAGTVTGLTNKTWDPNNITSGRGATEDQLKAAQAAATSKVAAGNGIKVTPNVDATTGSTTYTVAADTTALNVGDGTNGNPAGKVITPTGADANKLATAGDIANAINNSGFNINAGGNVVGTSTATTAKPGSTLTLKAGDGLTVKQELDGNGNQSYTYALDSQSVVQNAQTPVVYTKADGTKVYKQPDGKFYDAPTGGNEVAAGDVIASMQDAAGSTTAPTTLANVKGNLADTSNATGNPSGNDRTALTANNKGNNAATVNDVLNAGFTVQGNGADKDFVTHGDTINFANGQGTVANVSTTGGVTTVKFDTPMTYADTAGNPTTTPSNKVNLVGGTAGSPVTLGNVANGTIAAGSKEAINGGQLHDLKENGFKIAADNGTPDTVKLTETVTYKGDSNIVTTVTNNQVGFKLADSITVGPATGGNPVKIDGNAGTVTGLTNKTWDPNNITSGRGATEDQLKAAQAAATSKVAAGNGIKVTPNVDATTGSTTYTVAADTTALNVGDGTNGNPAGKVITPTGADANKLATAGDIANAINNSGFNINAGGNVVGTSTATTAKPGSTLTLKAGDGLTVKQELDGNGNQSYTYALDSQSVVQNAQTPVVYTKADGTKVYKQPDGKFYDAPTGGNEVAAGDVIASMQDAAGSTTAPTTLANVKGNLADTSNATGNPSGNDRTALTANNKGNNAATVNDVLNAGFTVQGNGADKDFVTHGDTINFANGQGTVANVSTTGGVTTVKFDTPMTYADTAGNPTTTPSNKVNLVGGTAGSPVTLGNVADGNIAAGSKEAVNGGQLHATNQNVANNAANIAKGINFGGTTGSNNYRLGDTINVKGDSNITSTTVAGGAQLALNPNLNVTSVTTTDAAGNKTVTNGSGVTITPASGNPVSLTTGGLNNGGNKITNVAEGTAGTDAVNVSQLNQAIGAIAGSNTANFTALNNKVNEVAADAKAGTAAAMAVAGLPQAYLPGKSMMAVGGSVYRGESGYAIGYSTISDGGNWIIKGTATGNSRGHYGATAAVGYQW